MKVKKIKNPKTHRYIRVDGPTYHKLQREGYDLRGLKWKWEKRSSRQYANTANDNFSQIDKLPVGHYVTAKGRGSATRGWGEVAPKRGRPRNRLLEKCGPACFLKPDTLSFPICPRDKCEIDCRGVNAAYIRARQWKYDRVGEEALKLKKKCGLY